MLKGGPTKPEIIAIALEKLDIKNNETFVDIGCGTGHVSIAAAKYTDKILAVDRRKTAIETAQQNLKNAGVLHAVTLILGEAPDILSPYKNDIDKAFIGGTANFKEVIGLLIPHCRRVVLNAARLELAAEAILCMKDMEIFDEALLVNIAKGYELKGFTGFEPRNPVFMVVGTC